jgi:hypothetical protein
MTTISFTAVPTALAGLSISGVKILDIDKIPDSGIELLTPVLFPDPANWISGISVVRETMGVGGTGKYDLNYNLNYVYLHAPAGGNISDFGNFSAMITKLGLICTELANNDQLGGVDDFTIDSVSEPGFIEAPDKTIFHGCRLTFRVLKFV